jgi:predicted metal-binding protein
MISEYSQAAIFHFGKKVEKGENRRDWSKGVVSNLVKLERGVFLAGYYKTLLLSFEACGFCEECAVDRAKCKNPRIARPGADAMGIDVYSTARKAGYHIQVLKDYDEPMNRYAFLLVE